MARLTLFTWLLCCFLGTLLLFLGAGMTGGSRFDSAEMLPIAGVALGVSLVVSIPAMVIFGFIANGVYRTNNLVQSKGITSLYAVVSTFATFFIIISALGLLGHSSELSFLGLFALPYAISFVLAICVLKWPGQGLRTPEPLWADDTLAVFPEKEAPLREPFPTGNFYAVIATVVLGLVITLFQIVRALSINRGMFQPQLFWMVGIALIITGLIFFCLRRGAGWKILMILTAANLTGQALYVVRDFRFLTHSGIHEYLLMLCLYFAMDLAMMILLLRPALRRAYRVSEQQYWVWILAGGGYGMIRLFLLKMI